MKILSLVPNYYTCIMLHSMKEWDDLTRMPYRQLVVALYAYRMLVKNVSVTTVVVVQHAACITIRSFCPLVYV
jgi:hypothetical protein